MAKNTKSTLMGYYNCNMSKRFLTLRMRGLITHFSYFITFKHMQYEIHAIVVSFYFDSICQAFTI